MNVQPWILGGFVVLTGVYALLFVYAFRRGRPSTGANVDVGGEDRTTTSGDTVQCRECGTENGAEYRFCRECVSELPGVTVRRSGGSVPQSRFMR